MTDPSVQTGDLSILDKADPVVIPIGFEKSTTVEAGNLSPEVDDFAEEPLLEESNDEDWAD